MIVEAVRAVLTAIDEQGEADHAEWREQVRGSITSLESSYRILREVNRELIDYSELSTQAAYLYRYVIGHSEFVYQILKRAREAAGNPLFPAGNLWVTSLGGGPGSDLLGVIKYLRDNDDEPDIDGITYTVIDKERNWEHVVELFCEHFSDVIDIKLYYQTCDLSDKKLPESVSLKDEDLVVSSFFISEVCAIPGSLNVKIHINSLLRTMKSQAVLVYNDSSAYSFWSFFQDRVNSAKSFTEVLEVREDIRADAPDYDGIFSEYAEEFGYGFKLSGNAVAKTLIRIDP